MISFNTLALKEALSKCGKCAKNDKTAPLTQLLHIKTRDAHTVEFTATDERNIFTYYLIDTLVDYEQIDVCILIDQLTKLVSKFTCNTVDMFYSESSNELKLKGDGTYTISIPVDAEGLPIRYPEVDLSEPDGEVYTGTVSSIINAAKYCEGSITKLSYDIQVEDYPRTNYFVGKDVIALDGFLATQVTGKFLPFDTLVSPATIKLLTLFTDAEFKAYKTKTYIVYECADCKLLSKEPEGLDSFPTEVAIETIASVTGNEMNVAAGVLVNALNRLNLFTETKYDNSIKLKFTKAGLFAYTLDESCVEQISSEPLETEFNCFINVTSFLALLKPYGADILKLYYGDEQCLKIEYENVKQIIVLSDMSE